VTVLNRAEIERVFGTRALEFALFYHHEHSLRFELAQGPSRFHRFLSAHRRATEIMNQVFDGSSVQVCLKFFGIPSLRAHLSVFRSLRNCGIVLPEEHQVWCVPDEETHKILIAFEVEPEYVTQLLWGVFALELGIRPGLLCKVYFFDLERGVLVHPYDDRGMDVIGQNTALLKRLYQQFGAYLLEYDKAQMDRSFGSA
jgi:Domain of unknown function (DUF3885)